MWQGREGADFKKHRKKTWALSAMYCIREPAARRHKSKSRIRQPNQTFSTAGSALLGSKAQT